MHYQHQKFALKELDLQKSDLHHMFGNQDADLLTQLDWEKMMDELDLPNQIQGGFYIFEDVRFDKEKKTITIENIPLNVGPVLYPRFKNVKKIAVTVCTAGANLDQLSKNHIGQGEILIGYSLDALGAVIAEKVLEKVTASLKNSMQLLGYSITGCYCPGYCDWPLLDQKKIFGLLPEKFCSVTLSDSCLMVPLKSVSGLIGIGVDVQEDFPQCRICPMYNCYMRKEAYSIQAEND
jgi:hypothetical protein